MALTFTPAITTPLMTPRQHSSLKPAALKLHTTYLVYILAMANSRPPIPSVTCFLPSDPLLAILATLFQGAYPQSVDLTRTLNSHIFTPTPRLHPHFPSSPSPNTPSLPLPNTPRQDSNPSETLPCSRNGGIRSLSRRTAVRRPTLMMKRKQL